MKIYGDFITFSLQLYGAVPLSQLLGFLWWQLPVLYGIITMEPMRN